MNIPLLEAKNIIKGFYQPDKTRLIVLQDLCLQVQEGSIVAITGASGSGKSTLLHLIGSLDTPDSGMIHYNGKDILSFSDKERAEYRNRMVGFLYQFHYLMPELNVLENVAFPSLLKNFERELAFSDAENC